jgi:hypothetical protein
LGGANRKGVSNPSLVEGCAGLKAALEWLRERLLTKSKIVNQCGYTARTISQELGEWQTLSMVERYAHLSPAHKAQAVERIALETPSEPEKSVLEVAL